MINRFAVVLTHNRPEMLAQTVGAIAPQVDMVIVIDNASDPPVNLEAFRRAEALIAVMRTTLQPPNLAEFWQLGIDVASMAYGVSIAEEYVLGDDAPEAFVAFLCDDAPPPPRWFFEVHNAMQKTGAAIGCSPPDPGHCWTGAPRVKTAPDGDLVGRMPGWAFVLRLASGIRPDTSMRWWWFDTDLDWQARAAGGMVMIGSLPVLNVHPNDWTWAKPELGTQTGADRAAFVAKHGSAPW